MPTSASCSFRLWLLTSSLVLLFWVIFAACGWLVFAFLANRLLENPRGDTVTGLFYHGARIYCRVVHRLVVEGRENIPTSREPGPLIVVCNHTAGLDPVLLQASVPFPIRFMMATKMRLPIFEVFWEWAGIISITTSGRDLGGVREALRHLRDGGVVGIFPEGAIERPPQVLVPFMAGTGILIGKSGAKVLPIAITGTPYAAKAWGSLWRRSRSRLRVGPVVEFDRGTPAAAIVVELQAWFEKETGWPVGTRTAPTPTLKPDRQSEAG